MSTTALGPLLDLDGPLPVAPTHGLLSIPGVDQGQDPDPVDSGDDVDGADAVSDVGRWQGGVTLYPYPKDTPFLFDNCDTGTFRIKDEGELAENQRFDPLGVYLPIKCSAIGLSNSKLDAFYERAVEVLRATLSYAAEQILGTASQITNNPSLGDASLEVLATNVSARVGLSYLEKRLADSGRGGIIHLPPAVTDALMPIRIGNDADPLYTGNGTPIASGAGYNGIAPVGQTAPSGTKQWAFVTGPVRVHRGAIATTSSLQSVDQTDNVVVLRPELPMLVEWDVTVRAGVLIDWSL